ncbi:MAG: CoA-binding protein [Euryarchaeota archaeon]|nr:CoA-binding protein [Euryarchaeota archaeon]
MKVAIHRNYMHALRKFDTESAIERSLEFSDVAIISDDFGRDSPALGDMKGLMLRGFKVHPVSDKLAGKNVKANGMEIFESVADLDDEVQIVVVNTKSELIHDVLADLSLRTELWADIRTVWLEPGVEVDEKVLSDIHDFGWMLVQGRCILAEVMERNISHD